jgi:uncharacterized lipoprotein YehR (DUF1307 family)
MRTPESLSLKSIKIVLSLILICAISSCGGVSESYHWKIDFEGLEIKDGTQQKVVSELPKNRMYLVKYLDSEEE